MSFADSYTIFPLGDSAITIDFGNKIDPLINQKVIALFQLFQQIPVQGMIEAVPAYSSLTIYYDVLLLSKSINEKTSAYDRVKKEINKLLQDEVRSIVTEQRIMKIPVCYDREFAPDLDWIAEQKNLSASEIISIHTGKKYKIYMIGFLPGFAYMGEVDDQITVPRKLQPRQYVAAGSVGIAGKQTGIYPLPSPGGWQIIGRTPMKLFEVPSVPVAIGNSKEMGFNEESVDIDPVLLKAGDEVQFYSISKEEFLYMQQ